MKCSIILWAAICYWIISETINEQVARLSPYDYLASWGSPISFLPTPFPGEYTSTNKERSLNYYWPVYFIILIVIFNWLLNGPCVLIRSKEKKQMSYLSKAISNRKNIRRTMFSWSKNCKEKSLLWHIIEPNIALCTFNVVLIFINVKK